MYLYGFDIGGTKCAVILAKVEGDQVDFLERYEMKTLGDWKKVLDELSENALMIAKKYGLTVSYRITCNNGNQRTLINP